MESLYRLYHVEVYKLYHSFTYCSMDCWRAKQALSGEVDENFVLPYIHNLGVHGQFYGLDLKTSLMSICSGSVGDVLDGS